MKLNEGAFFAILFICFTILVLGSYSSEKLTPKRWNDLIQKCIKSLEEKE